MGHNVQYSELVANQSINQSINQSKHLNKAVMLRVNQRRVKTTTTDKSVGKCRVVPLQLSRFHHLLLTNIIVVVIIRTVVVMVVLQGVGFLIRVTVSCATPTHHRLRIIHHLQCTDIMLCTQYETQSEAQLTHLQHRVSGSPHTSTTQHRQRVSGSPHTSI